MRHATVWSLLCVLPLCVCGADLVLSWTDNADDETGFRLERSHDGGESWLLLAFMDADVESHVDLSVPPGSVVYRLAAVNDFGQSAYSVSESIVVEAEAVPGAPGELIVGERLVARLRSLSARGLTGIGDETHIGGFRLEGDSAQVLLRAIGPGLERFGIPGFLADPTLTLLEGATVIASNDDWTSDGDMLDAFAAVSAFSLSQGSADAVLLVELDPGSYTFHVSGKGDETGVSLIEVILVP